MKTNACIPSYFILMPPFTENVLWIDISDLQERESFYIYAITYSVYKNEADSCFDLLFVAITPDLQKICTSSNKV